MARLRHLALGCTVWLGLALLALALGAASSGTTVHTLLPAAMRRELVAFELALLAACSLPTATALALLHAAFTGPGAARRAVRVAAAVVGVTGLWLYALSWVTFRSTGRFLDADGFAFMAMNPWPFLQHVAHLEPLLLLAVPGALVALTVVFAWGLPRLVGWLGPRGNGALVAAGVVSAGICIALSVKPGDAGFRGEPEEGYAGGFFFDPKEAVIDPEAGMVYTYGELYTTSRDDRSGPVSHAFADLRDGLDDERARLRSDPGIPVERRPILSMGEYLEGVDRSRVRRRNVLVIVIESLRPDQLQSFGGGRDVMPGIDAIARESRLYPDHYTQASHSNYADICLLSSHYPLRSPKVHVYPENPSYPRVLVYDVLKALGWRTAVISSQNEIWGGMIHYLKTGSIDHFFHSESFDGPTYVPRHDAGFEDFLLGSKRSGKIDDRFTIDEAIRWIGSIDPDDPFFLYLNLQNSHLPYETPADFPRRFGPKNAPFPITFAGFPRSGVPIAKALYADSLAYVDHQLGRLVAFLQQHERWRDSLVVITGDTGQAFYEHGFVAHANQVYNEVMRVPLLIHGPEIEAGVDPRPAQHLDIPPTILDALSLPPHPSFQGVSLLARSPASRRSRFVMAQTPLAHQYAVIRGRYKLIYDVRRDASKLFDLARDPGERVDIGGRESVRAEELRVRLDTWRQHQLDYYADPRQHSRTYPPVLRD